MILIRRIKTFFKFDFTTKLCIIEAMFFMTVYKVIIVLVPFSKLKNKIGKYNLESSEEVDLNSYRVAKQVRWAINIGAKHTLWESKCLVQALTAQKMMRRRNIPITLYLGLKKDSDKKLIAHAWTRCGNYYITGGNNKTGYVVVAKFAASK